MDYLKIIGRNKELFDEDIIDIEKQLSKTVSNSSFLVCWIILICFLISSGSEQIIEVNCLEKYDAPRLPPKIKIVKGLFVIDFT